MWSFAWGVRSFARLCLADGVAHAPQVYLAILPRARVRVYLERCTLLRDVLRCFGGAASRSLRVACATRMQCRCVPRRQWRCLQKRPLRVHVACRALFVSTFHFARSLLHAGGAGAGAGASDGEVGASGPDSSLTASQCADAGTYHAVCKSVMPQHVLSLSIIWNLCASCVRCVLHECFLMVHGVRYIVHVSGCMQHETCSMCPHP